jgi:hypothetical protein
MKGGKKKVILAEAEAQEDRGKGAGATPAADEEVMLSETIYPRVSRLPP